MLSAARHSTRPFALLAWLLCLPALGAAAAAQEVSQTPAPAESDEVVRVTTELVQTDVMVFDKQGKFVDGLTADQFDLRVDGKPQAITFFERVKAGAVDEDAQLAAARGGATRREGDKSGAVLPLDRGRTVFFFIDDIHLSHGSLVRVQKTLLKFIEDELGQNDEAAIISATGQPGFLQQLTGEKAVLRAAVERLKPRSFAMRDMQQPPMSESQALAIDRNDSSVTDYFVDALQRETPQMSRATLEQMVMMRARGILAQTNHYAVNTLASLEGVVRGSAPLPGRKLVFFISDGFLLDTRDAAKDRLQRVTDAAARSGVVI
ncbi:MAG TPA: VWA domain-containing protein, partial [Pyrinomonadaceae bacterium]